MPLTLFSGESGTADLIAHAAEIGVLMLIVLAIAKLFATSLLLATGWKGGYIFPIMFASVALGLGANLLFPGIPVAVAVAATMAGAMVASLKAPLFAALFTTVLVQKETAPAMAVAIVASALLLGVLGLRQAARAAKQAQPNPLGAGRSRRSYVQVVHDVRRAGSLDVLDPMRRAHRHGTQV